MAAQDIESRIFAGRINKAGLQLSLLGSGVVFVTHSDFYLNFYIFIFHSNLAIKLSTEHIREKELGRSYYALFFLCAR